MVALAVVIVGSAFWLDYWVYRYTGFKGENHAADLELVSSKMFFTADPDGKRFTIVGQLRNLGAVAVDRVEIETRVSNQDGTLIDSYHNTLSDHLGPGDETTFKLSSYDYIHLPEDQYADYELVVRSAKSR